MDPQILNGVIAQNRERVANVKEDQLGDATPCGDWNVKELVNHMIGGNFLFSIIANGGEVDPKQATPDFVAQGDFAQTYNKAADSNIAGWKLPGVMEKPFALPFATLPGNEAFRIALLEAVVHGWDLAKATGQDSEISEQLAAPMLSGVKMVIPPGTRPAELPFGPEVTVPETASTTDKLVAYLGRKP